MAASSQFSASSSTSLQFTTSPPSFLQNEELLPPVQTKSEVLDEGQAELASAIVDTDRIVQDRIFAQCFYGKRLNFKYLIEASRLGFHLCLPTQLSADRFFHIRAGINGVFQATFQIPHTELLKRISFFPLKEIDELIDILRRAEPIASFGNRQLCVVPGQPYLIEVFRRLSMVTAVRPVFYFAKWDVCPYGHPILWDEHLISMHGLLGRAQEGLMKYHNPRFLGEIRNPVQYWVNTDQGTDLVVDVAPFLPELGVNQGIFIQFPKELLYEN
jgi:hypothetical protein